MILFHPTGILPLSKTTMTSNWLQFTSYITLPTQIGMAKDHSSTDQSIHNNNNNNLTTTGQ